MRFLSRDPIGGRGGINLYEYVDDNPVNFKDPAGFQALGQAAKAVAACMGVRSTHYTQAKSLS